MKTAIYTTILSLTAVSTAFATDIEVAQESAAGVGDFDANVLGTIRAIDSPLSAVQYYDYRYQSTLYYACRWYS